MVRLLISALIPVILCGCVVQECASLLKVSGGGPILSYVCHYVMTL